MAVRTPLLIDGNENLIEMTSGQITEVVTRAFWQYINNPTVTLSVVSSGGNLGTISDTRLQAGTGLTDPSSFPSEAQTPEPSLVTVNYSRIEQTLASVSAFELALAQLSISKKGLPIYYNASNQLQSMNLQDMYDTFIEPAIDLLIAGGEIYTISTSTSLTGYTLVSSTPVFNNTIADTSAYTAGSIPETLDQPTTTNSYYLHKRNFVDTSYSIPARLTSGNQIETPSSSTFDTVLYNFIGYMAISVSPYQIRYAYNGGAGYSNCGTAMTDNRLNGSGNYQTRFVNANDYRAQEFPNGSSVTINTYNLTVGKT